MKRYKLKDEGEIEAQQFSVDQDFGSWPPCTEKHRWKANVYEVRCNDKAPFHYEDIADLDYVVIASSGWRKVVKLLEFDAKYEEVK